MLPRRNLWPCVDGQSRSVLMEEASWYWVHGSTSTRTQMKGYNLKPVGDKMFFLFLFFFWDMRNLLFLLSLWWFQNCCYLVFENDGPLMVPAAANQPIASRALKCKHRRQPNVSCLESSSMEGFRSTPDCQDVLIWMGKLFREKVFFCFNCEKKKPAGAELCTPNSGLMQESLSTGWHWIMYHPVTLGGKF